MQGLLLNSQRDRWATTVLLPPLDPEQLTLLLEHVLQRSEIPREFRDLVYTKTRGNPFYTTEILQSLSDEGILFRTDRGWEWKPVDEIRLPTSIAGTIGARVRRLDPDSLQLLRIASLLGQEFPLDLLQAVAEVPLDRLLLSLERAGGARLIKERAAGRTDVGYVFAHPLIQEVLEKEVSVVRSHVLHLRAAQVLEARYGASASDHAATLAYHYLRGNDPKRALEYSTEAGNRAAAVFARAEAAGHYRNALDLLPQPRDPGLAAPLTERLADQVRGLGDVPEAARLFVEAGNRWKAVGNRSSAGDCLRRAADCWLGPQAEGQALLEEARTLL
ncbi:MAG: ATP-binding protein, partial [Candidatus Lutacidiplasmatales archaeon]